MLAGSLARERAAIGLILQREPQTPTYNAPNIPFTLFFASPKSMRVLSWKNKGLPSPPEVAGGYVATAQFAWEALGSL